MEPRILFIADGYTDALDLLHILDENDIFYHCENIDPSSMEKLLKVNRINLILLDESCFSLLGFLNSLTEATGVIIVLHHHNEETIKTSWNYNISGFVVKPNYYGLLPAIEKALSN
ncbi:hypothetical protein [Halobacillus massiliensis]|uniref:hypothetical protein n=1 Tax=Halobacillus massiliensis TaxID=1926286 RepID=UPI0009E43C1B|nr:hypothetical protein [Halobacillus massiliensis]